MSEPIQIAIISAGLAALVNSIFQVINKIIDNREKRRSEQISAEIELREKKEQTYIAAIGRLLQIRRGFDFTSEDVNRREKIKKMIEDDDAKFAEYAPKLRLYASDKIFNYYISLAEGFRSFAYASQYGPRLFENTKTAFSNNIILLSHLMQQDLGYRVFNKGIDTVNCPKCRTKHDIVSGCPKCGLSFEEHIEYAQKDLMKKWEEAAKESEHGEEK